MKQKKKLVADWFQPALVGNITLYFSFKMHLNVEYLQVHSFSYLYLFLFFLIT